jgi:hypothetical protein
MTITTATDHWKRYLGLPHGTGADPEDGHAADCLLLAFRVLDMLEAPHPAVDPNWFNMAEQMDWAPLKALFDATTEPSHGPGEGAVSLLRAPTCLGMVVSIGGGVLFVDQSTGVNWTPLHLCRRLRWRRFRSLP